MTRTRYSLNFAATGANLKFARFTPIINGCVDILRKLARIGGTT